jgi:hypothetical protein
MSGVVPPVVLVVVGAGSAHDRFTLPIHGHTASGFDESAHNRFTLPIHGHTARMSGVAAVVVGMAGARLRMGFDPHQMSLRRQADSAQYDSHLQAIPSVGAIDMLLPHRSPPLLPTLWIS